MILEIGAFFNSKRCSGPLLHVINASQNLAYRLQYRVQLGLCDPAHVAHPIHRVGHFALPDSDLDACMSP
jgi:hypothetical protein